MVELDMHAASCRFSSEKEKSPAQGILTVFSAGCSCKGHQAVLLRRSQYEGCELQSWSQADNVHAIQQHAWRVMSYPSDSDAHNMQCQFSSLAVQHANQTACLSC